MAISEKATEKEPVRNAERKEKAKVLLSHHMSKEKVGCGPQHELHHRAKAEVEDQGWEESNGEQSDWGESQPLRISEERTDGASSLASASQASTQPLAGIMAHVT